MNKLIDVLLLTFFASLTLPMVPARGEVPAACFEMAKTGGGAGGGNGGLSEEILFKGTLYNIAQFLETETGKALYPEFSTDEFSAVVNGVMIFMKDVHRSEDEIRDVFGNVRDCAWSREKCSITCNRARYAKILKGSSKALPIVLPGHEVFAMLGYENGTREAPSGNTFSTRLIPYAKQISDLDLRDGRPRITADQGRLQLSGTEHLVRVRVDQIKPRDLMGVLGIPAPVTWRKRIDCTLRKGELEADVTFQAMSIFCPKDMICESSQMYLPLKFISRSVSVKLEGLCAGKTPHVVRLNGARIF